MKKDEVEKILKRLADQTVPEDVRRLAEEKSEQFSDYLTKPKHKMLWRNIMNRKITKLAAAAVIVLVVVLSMKIINKTIPTAYAIEQTIEAIREARIIHMFCRDWHDDELEVWMKLNPETRLPDYVYIDYPKHNAQILSTPHISYQYFKEANLFQFSKQQLMNFDIRLENILEDIAAEIAKESSDIDIKIYTNKNSDTGENEIVVLSKGKSDSLEIGIDPKTKLPTKINIIKTSNYGNFIRSFDEIYFDQEPPAGLFEFKIPEDSTVVNQDETDKFEKDPNCGVLLNGISKQEAANILSSKYFKAVINHDFERLRKIYPAMSLKQAKNVYKNLLGGNFPVELIKIRELAQEYGCTNNPISPCIVRHQDGTLKEYNLIIKFREIEGQVSAVITGLCGMPQEIESIH